MRDFNDQRFDPFDGDPRMNSSKRWLPKQNTIFLTVFSFLAGVLVALMTIQMFTQDRCSVNRLARRIESLASASFSRNREIVLVVTPTYTRPTQMSDLMRVAHSLMLAEDGDVLWLVVEDSPNKTKWITNFLAELPLPHVHLLGPRPRSDYFNPIKGAGSWPRNAALQWLHSNYQGVARQHSGVVYFADDDNAYDRRLWRELKRTTVHGKVSVLPVGLIGSFGVSVPIINMTSGKVVDFHDAWAKPSGRTFSVDTAGFAVDLRFLLSNPLAHWPSTLGYEEDGFLKSLKVTLEDLVPIAKNCTEVLVWHTKSRNGSYVNRENMIQLVANWNQTNLPLIYEKLVVD